MIKFREFFESGTALLVIDMQNDFMSGKNAIPGATSILPTVNSLISQARSKNIPVIFIAEIHAPETLRRPAEKRYCLRNTFGANFHSDLDIGDSAIFDKEAWSGFSGHHRDNKESLLKHLHNHNIDRIIACGLALDYCVLYTATEARHHGLNSAVVINASKGMYDYNGSELDVLKQLRQAGVEILRHL